MKKIQYSVAMLANPQKAEEPKKAYASLQLTGVVTMSELAKHMTEHNTVYSKGTIVGVLTEMGACMRELVLQGYKIDLDSLGTFAPSISSTGAQTKEEFTASNIKSMGICFNPGSDFDNLRRDAQFERTISRKAQAAALKAENAGKTQADWSVETDAANDGEPEGGNAADGEGNGE